MPSTRLAICLTLVAGALAGPAQPAAAEPIGRLCGFASITDPTVEGDVQTGVIDGGPLFDPDYPANDVYIGCTIQVGAQGATHAGANAYSVWGWGIGAAVLPPHQFTYIAPEGAPIYLCTEFWIDTGIGHETMFWNANEFDRGWSSSNSAQCALAISQEVDPGDGEELDPILCPVLASLASTFPSNGPLAAVLYIKSAAESPNGGDTYVAGSLFWDCPTYEG